MSILPDGLAFWKGLIVIILGIVVTGIGLGYEFLTLAENVPDTPYELWLMFGGVAIAVLGVLWYWISRPLYYWYQSPTEGSE